jgi:Asp/Glu/hydantoin racemase
MSDARSVVLVHTVAGLAPVFNSLARELLPSGTRTVHVVDENLLQDTIRDGAISDHTRQRLRDYVDFAGHSGATAVLVTCSSVGPAVEAIAADSSLPVLRVDTAIADQAVQLGTRVGVLGTLSTTLEPTANLIRARAARAARPVTVDARLAHGAFDALQAGHTEEHDARVLDTLRQLQRSVDVVVLAQASMARVADQLSADERKIPILASPRLAVQRLVSVLGA